MHSLCRNCFRTGHQAKNCTSKYSCRNCKGRHHTLVCFQQLPERENAMKALAVAGSNNSSNPKEHRGQNGPTTSHVANLAATDTSVLAAANQAASKAPSHVLLATAVVIVEDDYGNRYPARALLDSGSESNFISERLAQLMKVTREKVDISVLGIGQSGTKVKHKMHATVRSRLSNYERDMSFLVLSKVTVNLPTKTIATKGWSIPDGIELADPAFFESKRVDIVLGIECFFEFFETGRRIPLGDNLPALNESVFGWVVSGGLSVPCN